MNLKYQIQRGMKNLDNLNRSYSVSDIQDY